MKSVLFAAVAALALLSSPVRAAEVSIKLDDGSQNAVAQLPALLDQCVSGVMVHGDGSVCRTVSNFLAALGNEVKSAQGTAALAAKVAAEEAKKAAEKADKPADTKAPAPQN